MINESLVSDLGIFASRYGLKPIMRLKVKGTTFFGQYLGIDKKTGKVKFLDEELGTVKLYPANKLEKAYEK